MTDTDLDIPQCLRIPQTERAAAWRDYKPPAAVVNQAEAWQRMEQQRREQKQAKARARISALKAKKAATAEHDAIPTSRRTWCVKTSKWVEM